jgi:hypothetical protein
MKKLLYTLLFATVVAFTLSAFSFNSTDIKKSSTSEFGLGLASDPR